MTAPLARVSPDVLLFDDSRPPTECTHISNIHRGDDGVVRGCRDLDGVRMVATLCQHAQSLSGARRRSPRLATRNVRVLVCSLEQGGGQSAVPFSTFDLHVSTDPDAGTLLPASVLDQFADMSVATVRFGNSVVPLPPRMSPGELGALTLLLQAAYSPVVKHDCALCCRTFGNMFRLPDVELLPDYDFGDGVFVASCGDQEHAICAECTIAVICKWQPTHDDVNIKCLGGACHAPVTLAQLAPILGPELTEQTRTVIQCMSTVLELPCGFCDTPNSVHVPRPWCAFRCSGCNQRQCVSCQRQVPAWLACCLTSKTNHERTADVPNAYIRARPSDAPEDVSRGMLLNRAITLERAVDYVAWLRDNADSGFVPVCPGCSMPLERTTMCYELEHCGSITCWMCGGVQERNVLDSALENPHYCEDGATGCPRYDSAAYWEPLALQCVEGVCFGHTEGEGEERVWSCARPGHARSRTSYHRTRASVAFHRFVWSMPMPMSIRVWERCASWFRVRHIVNFPMPAPVLPR